MNISLTGYIGFHFIHFFYFWINCIQVVSNSRMDPVPEGLKLILNSLYLFIHIHTHSQSHTLGQTVSMPAVPHSYGSVCYWFSRMCLCHCWWREQQPDWLLWCGESDKVIRVRTSKRTSRWEGGSMRQAQEKSSLQHGFHTKLKTSWLHSYMENFSNNWRFTASSLISVHGDSLALSMVMLVCQSVWHFPEISHQLLDGERFGAETHIPLRMSSATFADALNDHLAQPTFN